MNCAAACCAVLRAGPLPLGGSTWEHSSVMKKKAKSLLRRGPSPLQGVPALVPVGLDHDALVGQFAPAQLDDQLTQSESLELRQNRQGIVNGGRKRNMGFAFHGAIVAATPVA